MTKSLVTVYFWLYEQDAWAFALLTVAAWSALSAGGVLLTRRLAARLWGAGENRNELVGFFLSAIGVFYGISLGLIAVGAWEHYTTIQTRVAEEAATIATLKADFLSFPSPLKEQLADNIEDYLDFVVDCAWPAQSHGEEPKGDGTIIIKPMREGLNNFEPKTSGQANLQAEAMRRFNDLLHLRRLRIESVTHKMDPTIWVVVLFGGVLNIFVTWLFLIKPTRTHVVLNGLIGMMIGLLIFLIAAMDQPFRGKMGVSPQSFVALHKKHDANAQQDEHLKKACQESSATALPLAKPSAN